MLFLSSRRENNNLLPGRISFSFLIPMQTAAMSERMSLAKAVAAHRTLYAYLFCRSIGLSLIILSFFIIELYVEGITVEKRDFVQTFQVYKLPNICKLSRTFILLYLLFSLLADCLCHASVNGAPCGFPHELSVCFKCQRMHGGQSSECPVFLNVKKKPLSTTINFNGFDLLFCRLKFLCIICCHSETKLIGTGYFADDNQHDTNFCVWRYPPLLSSSIMIIGTALAVENILHPREKEGMELWLEDVPFLTNSVSYVPFDCIQLMTSSFLILNLLLKSMNRRVPWWGTILLIFCCFFFHV